MKVLKWKVDKKILRSGDYKLNNHIASKISKKGFKKIIKHYTDITPQNIKRILKKNKKFWSSFKGIGVDLGGGVGCVSSVVAQSPDNEKVYCVEVVKNAVVKCQPIVKRGILKKKSNKVVSVIGDFDNISLPTSSVDFCFAWESLHHSNNVTKTLKEAKRITKNKGKILIIDRAHKNSTPNKEIRRMLNVVYSKDFLKRNWLPQNKIFTRKQNGEHEYRFKEWKKFFKNARLNILEAFILKEKVKKNKGYKNDEGLKESFVNFKFGGFEKKKVMYMLGVVK